MAQKKKVEDDIVIPSKLEIRPEHVIRYYEDTGGLPDDYCPYGKGYVINPSNDLIFIGEKEPQTVDVSYKGAASYFGINDKDPDRKSIYITLPRPPQLDLIDGYGLPPEEQVWKRKPTPEKLRRLEKETLDDLQSVKKANRQEAITGYKLLDLFWEKFEDNYRNYDDEIKWMKHMWWWRIFGYWFYNDGVPTYITGRHFSFLTFFYMADLKESQGYPEYRDRHRREFLYREHLRYAHHAFAKRDERGWAVPEEDGSYEMMDMRKPIFLGDIHPKSRRNGSTMMGLHEMIEGAELGIKKYSTLISKDGDSTIKHFKESLIPAWNAKPMCFKPMWKGGVSPEQIKYYPPNNSFGVETIMGVIEPTTSAGMFKADGNKFSGFILFDEEGKCFDRNCMIQIYNGLPKKAIDIQVGDLVIGDDGLPRKVLSLHRGRNMMYNVIPKKGNSWRCNGNHIIVAKNCDTFIGTKKGDVVEISVKDYLKLSQWNKRSLVLYKKGAHYPKSEHSIDPYLLGLWLGDGSHSASIIVGVDKEIIDYLKWACQEEGWRLKKNDISYSIANAYWYEYPDKNGQIKVFSNKDEIVSEMGISRYRVDFVRPKGGTSFLSRIKKEGLYKNKHIPDSYLYDSRENRLKLLAGLIDTDGYAYKHPRLCYEITQVRKELAYQIYYLALGLGFYASINFKTTSYRVHGEKHECDGAYRVKIHGKDLHEVPCKVERKRYQKRDLHINTREPLHTGFSIEEDCVDDFYGFEIEGNGRFLLADHTVVHNSSTGTDVSQRWNVYRQAMTLGDSSKIIGWCSHVSTVEEINASGIGFLDILDSSDYFQRGSNGRTLSGLGAMFFPAYDGLEGFVDRFGMSVIGQPTDRQIELRPDSEFAILGKGAYQYQEENRADYIAKGTPSAMRDYRAYVKKFPHRSSELTIGTSGDCGFSYEIIDARIAELRKLKSAGNLPVKIGNFYRDGNNNPEGKVYWRTQDEGKFELSLELPPEQTNLKKRSMGWNVESSRYEPCFEPVYKSRFTMGLDPFEYSNSKTDTGVSKQSDGGIAVLWEHDVTIDRAEDQTVWESRRFVLSYRYRPASLQEFNEDCLMAAEYFGAMVFMERNKTSTWEYFIKRGRGNFLKYEQNLTTGKLADKPGFYSQGASKDDLFSEIKDYIEFRGHKEVHLPFLEECRAIRAKDDMTKYDRFTAHGAALLGSRSPHGKSQDLKNNQKIDLGKCQWLSR